MNYVWLRAALFAFLLTGNGLAAAEPTVSGDSPPMPLWLPQRAPTDVHEVQERIYLEAERAERGRVTDRLLLNHLPQERPWGTGEVISLIRALIRAVGLP